MRIQTKRKHVIANRKTSTTTVVDINGTVRHFNAVGKVHRAHDLPAIIRKDGTKLWFINGVPHRSNGPAAVYANGKKVWFVNGKIHRVDGPAYIYPCQQEEYWLEGKAYSKFEYEILVRKYRK